MSLVKRLDWENKYACVKWMNVFIRGRPVSKYFILFVISWHNCLHCVQDGFQSDEAKVVALYM